MARRVSTSEVPEDGSPWHVQLRSNDFKEKSSKKGGSFWKVDAGYPKSNPGFEGEYEPEYVDLAIWQPSLKRALEEATKGPAQKDHGRNVWPVTVFRLGEEWKVVAGYVTAPGDAPAPSTPTTRNDKGAGRYRPMEKGEAVTLLRGMTMAYALLDRAFADYKDLNVKPTADVLERMVVMVAIKCGDSGLNLVEEVRGPLRDLSTKDKPVKSEARAARGAPPPPPPPPSPPANTAPEPEDDLPF